MNKGHIPPAAQPKTSGAGGEAEWPSPSTKIWLSWALPYTATISPNVGAAYVIARQGKSWAQASMLTGDSTSMNDQFGMSVSLFGKNALVGVPFADTDAGTDAGSAYNFGLVRGSGDWQQMQIILDPAGAAGDFFGSSVVFSADTAVIGSPKEDTFFGSNTGKVLIFVP